MRMLTMLGIILSVTAAAIAAPVPQPKASTSDPRLAQLVTIECIGMRLHSALEKISARTRVTVRCGKNKDDWQVRDIPVVVCVKDMPLGTLLKILAGVTHTALRAQKVGDDISYRVCPDDKQQRQLDAYYEARRKAILDRAAWDWEVMTRVKDSKEAESLECERTHADKLFDLPVVRAKSRVIAAMGAQARDRVLAGETVTLRAKDASPEIEKLIRKAADEVWAALQRAGCEGPGAEDLENPFMTVRMDMSSESPTMAFSIQAGSRGLFTCMDEQEARDAARVAGGNLPARPKTPDLPHSDGPSTSSVLSLPTSYPNGDIWKKKLKLTSSGPDATTFADLVAALSEETGLNIIAEDFWSHSAGWQNGNLSRYFGVECRLDDIILQNLSLGWRFEQEGTTVTADDSDWALRHQNLVRESFMQGLIDKMEGDGVDLDDVLPMADMTPAQVREWVTDSRRLVGCAWGAFQNGGPERSLWALYYHLGAGEKAEAAANAGLPLSKLDPKVATDLLNQAGKLAREAGGADPGVSDEWNPDREIITSAVLRLKTNGNAKQHNYCLQIDAARGDGKIHIETAGTIQFPQYSPKRRDEVLKLQFEEMKLEADKKLAEIRKSNQRNR